MAISNGLLNYDKAGQGRPIIFIHGLSYDRRIWQPIVKLLSADFACVSLDIPGHGDSSDSAAYDLDSVAQQVKELADALHISEPIIVGHSIGAVIAAVYASQFATGALVMVDQPLEFAPLARG